jgi:hypothetical protein
VDVMASRVAASAEFRVREVITTNIMTVRQGMFMGRATSKSDSGDQQRGEGPVFVLRILGPRVAIIGTGPVGYRRSEYTLVALTT